MSYERYPPQALLTECTSQNTPLYPYTPPPQHVKATYHTQVHPYPFYEYPQELPQPGAGLMGPAQHPGVSYGPRIAMDPYHLQPDGASRSHLLDYFSPGLEPPRSFPSPARLTPMQPKFPPIFTGYFLCFDRSCQYIQRDLETHFTGLKYPQSYHTPCNLNPPHPARSGGTNAATTWWVGDPCFTAAGVSSPPALPVRGGNMGSFIGDSSPMKTHSIGNDYRPYGFNSPPTGPATRGLGIRTSDTNHRALENYNNYPPTSSVDGRAFAFERNTSPNSYMRISDPPNRNTHTGMNSVNSKREVTNSEASAFRHTGDSGLESTGNFNNLASNTRGSGGPVISPDSHIDASISQERIAFSILTGSDHDPTRVRNNTYPKSPRSSCLRENALSRNQVSRLSSNLKPTSVGSENYATMPPLAPHTYSIDTHPTSRQKPALGKNTENMEANSKDAATGTSVSCFNPLGPASPNHTAGSSPSIKFKAYKCCNCNTSHYEPFTSDQDICYNCGHPVCRACYNFWECCNCNTLGRFSNHTCDECGHEKCPRKCLFQIITKEAWLRVEALRATENRGTAEQQRREGMHKLGRMGDWVKFGAGERSGVNGLVKANFKPGTAGEKEEALKSLVSLREKVKASSKSGVASGPLFPAAPSHHQHHGQVPPVDVSGSLVTRRMGGDPSEDGAHYGTPKKGRENSDTSMAQSPQGSNGSPSTSNTTSPSTLAESLESPLESPESKGNNPSRITTPTRHSPPRQKVEDIQLLQGSGGRGDAKEHSLFAL